MDQYFEHLNNIAITVLVMVSLFFSCARIDGQEMQNNDQLSTEMVVGLWEMKEGCSCENAADLCFYPNGTLFISQACDNSFNFAFERDTLWIDNTRPAIVQFDTSIDEVITMRIHIKLPLCPQNAEFTNEWAEYAFQKKSGFVNIIDSISSDEMYGIWAQQTECNCITADTLFFNVTNLTNSLDELSPEKMCAKGNILYEMSSDSTIIEHSIKMAVWPNGKKMIRLEGKNNPCNINSVLETLNYYSVL